ncbi:MAG TPA: hypothetical protein PLI95_12260, partial [Polyangiaceae bacterium]|nr:hypothetical protein [Polyangiaceae bacterium]
DSTVLDLGTEPGVISGFGALHIARLASDDAVIATTIRDAADDPKAFIARVGSKGVIARGYLPTPGTIVGVLAHKAGSVAVLTEVRDSASVKFNVLELESAFSSSDVESAGTGSEFTTVDDPLTAGTVVFTSSGDRDIVMTRASGQAVFLAVHAPSVTINPTLPVQEVSLSVSGPIDLQAKAVAIKDQIVVFVSSEDTKSLKVVSASFGSLANPKTFDISTAMGDVFPYPDGTAGVLIVGSAGIPPNMYFGPMTKTDLEAFDWQSLKVDMSAVTPTIMSFIGDRHMLVGKRSWVSFGYADNMTKIGYTWLDSNGALRAQAYLDGFSLSSSKIFDNVAVPGDDSFYPIQSTLHYGWVEHFNEPSTKPILHYMNVKCQPVVDAGP